MHEKILIIEDDLDLLDNLKDLLEQAQYEVYTSENGSKGIDSAKKNLPDLILCDIMMAETDGYKVRTVLRNDPSTVCIPFIFLTAKSSLTDIRKGMMLGADDFITKPIRAKELSESIRVRLDRIKELTKAANLQNGSHHKKHTYNERILIKAKKENLLIKISEIACVTAVSEYSKVELHNGDAFIVRKLLREWEESLPETEFIRIHRSTIVNVNCIKKIDTMYNRALKIVLNYLNKEFLVSQRYASKLKSNLGF